MDDPQNWLLSGGLLIALYVVIGIVVASLILFAIYLLGKLTYRVIRWLFK